MAERLVICLVPNYLPPCVPSPPSSSQSHYHLHYLRLPGLSCSIYRGQTRQEVQRDQVASHWLTNLTEAWSPHIGLVTSHRPGYLIEGLVTSQRTGHLTEAWSPWRGLTISQSPGYLTEDWSPYKDLDTLQSPDHLT